MKKLILPILLASLLLTMDSAKCGDGKYLLKCIESSDEVLDNEPDRNEVGSWDGCYLSALILGTRIVGQGRFFKTPPGWNLGQGIEILRKYLKDHPELLNEDSRALVLKSFVAAYPIKAESPKN